MPSLMLSRPAARPTTRRMQGAIPVRQVSTQRTAFGFGFGFGRRHAGAVSTKKAAAQASALVTAPPSSIYRSLAVITAATAAMHLLSPSTVVGQLYVRASTTLFSRTDMVFLMGAFLVPVATSLLALEEGGISASTASKIHLSLLVAGIVVLVNSLGSASYLFRSTPLHVAFIGGGIVLAVLGAWGSLATSNLVSDVSDVITPNTTNLSSSLFSFLSISFAGWVTSVIVAYKFLHPLFFVRIPYAPVLTQQFFILGGLALFQICAASALKEAAATGRLNTTGNRSLAAGLAVMLVSFLAVFISIIVDGFGHTLAYIAVANVAVSLGSLAYAYANAA